MIFFASKTSFLFLAFSPLSFICELICGGLWLENIIVWVWVCVYVPLAKVSDGHVRVHSHLPGVIVSLRYYSFTYSSLVGCFLCGLIMTS